MASVIAVAAIAAAGCGSSSKSKSSTPAAPSTPAATTPATPSTTTTTTTATPTNVPASAPIGGSAFRAVLLSQAEHNGAPAGKAPQFVDCLIKQLQADGIKTAGDFKTKQATAKTAVLACNKSVGVNVKP